MSRNTTRSDRAFRSENRAVSEVIGAILVFALLFSVLVLIQVNAVPAANKQVEFEHNQRVTQDFQSLEETLYRVATQDDDAAVSVETGIVYPSRFFLLNPPPMTGSLRTTLAPSDRTSPNVFIENAEATNEEVRQYWGTGQSFTTRGIQYQPQYNELPNAGTLNWEHSVLYSQFEDGTIIVKDPSAFIDGDQIRLTLVQGNMSRGELSTSVPLTSISTERRSIEVRAVDATDPNPDPIEITVASNLDASEWRTEVYPDEIANQDDTLHNIVPGPTPGTVTFQLEPRGDSEPRSYQLSISSVRVGSSQGGSPKAEYVTDVGTYDRTTSEETSQRLLVEVRDRFNNPVSGEPVQVQAEVTDSGSTDPGKAGTARVVNPSQTNDDGQVAIEYTAPDIDGTENEDVTVTAWFGTAPDPSGVTDAQKVTFDVTVENSDKSGLPPQISSDTDGVSRVNPWEDSVRLIRVNTSMPNSAGSEGSDFYIELENALGEEVEFTGARLIFFDAQSSSANSIDPVEYWVGGTQTTITNANTMVLYENYEAMTPEDDEAISIGAGQTATVGFNAPGATSLSKDLIGLSVQYVDNDGNVVLANYFIDVP